jgi:predicted metalloprotease with PDZ domain
MFDLHDSHRRAPRILPALVVLAALSPARAAETPILLTVDASAVARRVVHAQLTIPAAPGPLTLYYPKWVPGTHGPSGPIGRLAGLKLSAAGQPLAWRRDPVELYAFHCDVPPGTDAVQAELVYVIPAQQPPFDVSVGVAASTHLAVLNWNALLLYPKGKPPETLTYAASLRLPSGWKLGTALPVAGESQEAIRFKPVPLPQLVDCPVLAGAHFRSFPLRVPDGTPHQLDVAGETPAALEVPADLLAGFAGVAAEAGALFGSRHYPGFHFLLALSDRIPSFGLEHHACSVNSASPRALGKDVQARWWLTFVFAHEYIHSWNGKYRRPAGLVTPDWQQPLRTDLLWVYEGLTQYLGLVLDARSGLWTAPQFREELAGTAANLDRPSARAWRSVLDTAVAAPLSAAPGSPSWRGVSDYYYEGVLIWLEADTLIRRQTAGRRSLDDFCKQFFGGTGGAVAIRPYEADDIFRALDAVAPYDWKSFFRSRLTSTAPHAPLGGITASGWKLVYTDVVPERSKARRLVDLSYSAGLVLAEDGNVTDVLEGTPAVTAGFLPGMRVVAVNDRRWSADVLHQALATAKAGAKPLELLVEEGDFLRTLPLDYKGGDRYPHLERDAGRPDLLSDILTAHAPSPPAAR